MQVFIYHFTCTELFLISDILNFTSPSENYPFAFLDVMCEVAEQLEETDVSTICEHFETITQHDIRDINKQERPQIALLILLLQKEIITRDKVDQLHRIVKMKSPASILLNYMNLLKWPGKQFDMFIL